MPGARRNRIPPLSPGLKLSALSLLLASALCLALVMLPPGARAATVWHVSPNSAGACTQADPNCASIQAAVNAASAGDTIQVAAGTYAEHVVIGKDLAVSGAGPSQTTVDGTQSGTVFTINSGTVSLSGMTVTNGKTSASGGGILNLGALTVANCTVSNNSAALGAVANNGGTVNITNSTVGGNAADNGGGVFNNGPGTVNVTNSSVNNNSASNSGGGIFNGGGGTLNVTDSAVSNNSVVGISSGNGGGIANRGTLSVTNSTVTNNSAGNGGGVFNSGAGGLLTVTSSTVTNNSAGDNDGGGILNQPGGTASVRSSIVAGNTAFSQTPDLSGHFTSQGHNLVGATLGINGFANGVNNDVAGTISAPVDAKLSPLAFYGGPTETQLPLCGSPAIDAGDDAVTGAPLGLATDQRGAARKSGSHADIGAVERQQGVQINSQDSGAGSLRQLVADAADGAVIDLDCAAAVTVALTSGELLINKNLTINGPGPSLLTVQRSAAQGTPNFRVFEVAAGKTFNLSGATVTNGHVANFSDSLGTGGGILNNGTMNVTNITVTGNSSDFQGGGIYNNGGATSVTSSTVRGNGAANGGGAGIYSNGTATITNSTVRDNSTNGSGGGIKNAGALTITGSAVSNNDGEGGGGIYNSAADNSPGNSATLAVTNSTVSGNLSFFAGGGGIYNLGTANVTNSTVSNNFAAGDGGGILNFPRGAVGNGATLAVTNSTISGNFGESRGGGINNQSASAPRLWNSIVAANNSSIGGLGSPAGPDLNGQFTSQGHNLVGRSDGTNGLTNGTSGDIVGTIKAPVDAQLLPLADYGGPTQTQMLRPTSPAIDAGDDAVLNPPPGLATDQRGFARKLGSHVDIGAVEFNAATDAPGGDFQFSAFSYTVGEGGGHVDVTVVRTGQLTRAAAVDFAPADNDPNRLLPCGAVSGNASSRCDYEATAGTLKFAPGDSSKTFTVLVNDDSFVEGTETAKLVLSNPTGDAVLGQQSTATLQILDNDSTPPAANPIDGAQSFVRQHYRDFLSREPDDSGLQFWTSGITSCGSDVHCVAVKRVNTSAAFFLSIEFQNTGYFVYRVYKAAFGDINPPQVPVPVRFDNFIRGTQTVGQGVIVGQGDWQQQLAANKSAFALAFVQRADFLARYPFSMSATAFVNDLDANAGGVLTDAEKAGLMGELAPTNEHPPGPSDFALRADVLQKVAENAVLQQREKNRAFVLMEYFGYLRRDPDDAPDADFSGYNFWLSKLDQFGGDFVKAEMVRAFTESAEYRQRFGP